MPRVSEAWLRKILTVLYERRHSTRAEIVRATRLNVASVSQAIQRLLHQGVVQRSGQLRSAVGRRRDELKLNSEAGYFVAVDLEGTRVRFGLTNFLGDVRHRWEVPVAVGRKLDLHTLARGIEAVLGNLGPRERSRVVALGLSYTGIMDRQGRVTAWNLGWEDFPLREKIRGLVDLPVFHGTESLAKLSAERWLGAARGRSHCVFVTVANGIGCASMNEGHPLLGRDGAAGELGHTIIDPAAPDRCNCGRTGCLEAIASSPNIVRQYLEKTGQRRKPIFGEQVVEVFARVREGDAAALEVIDRAGRYLGLALANLANLLNPELIVLGGDLIHAEDLFLPRIRTELARHVLPKMQVSLEVQMSALGMDIGLVGAASLAFHGALRDSALLKKICSAHPEEVRAA
jgi:glucokinase